MMMKSNVSKLSSKDLRKVSLRYMFGAQLGWNYERMMNVAYVRAVYPALKKLYKDEKELKSVLQSEMQSSSPSDRLKVPTRKYNSKLEILSFFECVCRGLRGTKVVMLQARIAGKRGRLQTKKLCKVVHH